MILLLQAQLISRDSKDSSLEIDHLEIDRLETQLSCCPLLADPAEYIADTVDLTRDHDARAYWLTCFKGAFHIEFHNSNATSNFSK